MTLNAGENCRASPGWQRIGTVRDDGAAIKQLELALRDGFPLNLSACRVAFSPADWPVQQAPTVLGISRDRPLFRPGARPGLARRPEPTQPLAGDLVGGPEDVDLSALLLAPAPPAAGQGERSADRGVPIRPGRGVPPE